MPFELGILETGRPAPEFEPEFGDYPAMFEALLAPVDGSIAFRSFRVFDGVFPADVDTCDAWLVTGSRSGVYDGDPWIAELKDFLKRSFAQAVPIVGICFGHQVLAEALGGYVEKSGKGWGIGVHEYRLVARPDWLEGDVGSFAIQALHQDQISDLPPNAEIVATSNFCGYGLLAYGDRAISFQGHPEITAAYAKKLITARRGGLYPTETADAALATVDRPNDASLVARWIVNFLQSATAPRRT